MQDHKDRLQKRTIFSMVKEILTIGTRKQYSTWITKIKTTTRCFELSYSCLGNLYYNVTRGFLSGNWRLLQLNIQP